MLFDFHYTKQRKLSTKFEYRCATEKEQEDINATRISYFYRSEWRMSEQSRFDVMKTSL